MDPAPNELAFEAALNSSGNIDCFLDDFFNFLSRRSDFFVECPPEGGPVGFLKGQAEELLITKFKKWQDIHKNTKTKSHLDKINQKAVDKNKIGPSTGVEVSTATSKRLQQISKTCDYNGFSNDKYAWTQTIIDLDLKINVGPEVKKGKDVVVDLRSDYVSVRLASEKEPLFAGKLEFSIVKEDSYWNLLPGEAVHFWLQKTEERWWTRIIDGEPAIDKSRIDAVKPMEDLNDEERMKVHELMWKEEQKRKGVLVGPSKDVEDILKNAWNVDGSPFKGQPYNPANINFGN